MVDRRDDHGRDGADGNSMIQSTLWLRNFLAGSPLAAEARRIIIDRPRVNCDRYAAGAVHLCSAVRRRRAVLMTKRRKVIVHIGTSADGYIARPDGDLEWLTSRPAPEGFYGMSAFMRSIDTKLLGRKTMARRHRHVPLDLHSVERFDDGLVQLRYHVRTARS
jgi:hypothetical protein